MPVYLKSVLSGCKWQYKYCKALDVPWEEHIRTLLEYKFQEYIKPERTRYPSFKDIRSITNKYKEI